MEAVATPATAVADHTIDLRGRTYKLPPLEVADFDKIVEHIVASRPCMLSMMINTIETMNVPPQRAELYIRLAMAESTRVPPPSAEEIKSYMQTFDGFVLTIWVLLEKRYPGEFSIESLRKEVSSMCDKIILKSMEDLARRRSETAPA